MIFVLGCLIGFIGLYVGIFCKLLSPFHVVPSTANFDLLHRFVLLWSSERIHRHESVILPCSNLERRLCLR